MGYTKTEVGAAMAAASNNPDLTVDYLVDVTYPETGLGS